MYFLHLAPHFCWFYFRLLSPLFSACGCGQGDPKWKSVRSFTPPPSFRPCGGENHQSVTVFLVFQNNRFSLFFLLATGYWGQEAQNHYPTFSFRSCPVKGGRASSVNHIFAFVNVHYKEWWSASHRNFCKNFASQWYFSSDWGNIFPQFLQPEGKKAIGCKNGTVTTSWEMLGHYSKYVFVSNLVLGPQTQAQPAWSKLFHKFTFSLLLFFTGSSVSKLRHNFLHHFLTSEGSRMGLFVTFVVLWGITEWFAFAYFIWSWLPNSKGPLSATAVVFAGFQCWPTVILCMGGAKTNTFLSPFFCSF